MNAARQSLLAATVAASAVAGVRYARQHNLAVKAATRLLGRLPDAYIANCTFIGPVAAEPVNGGRIVLINSTVHAPAGLYLGDPRLDALRGKA